MLVGLGNRNNFEPVIMETVGRIGMREALRMGVTSNQIPALKNAAAKTDESSFEQTNRPINK